MSLALITGMGCVSAAGMGQADTAAKLFSVPGMPRISERLAGGLPLPVFELPVISTDNEYSRTAVLLDIALREALENAGLTLDELYGSRVGVCFGTTVACQLNSLEYYRRVSSGDSSDNTPLRHFVNSNLAEAVKHELKFSGPAMTIANACASGTDAIGVGGMLIKNGVCDLVIAGGADELSLISLAGFNSLGVCSPYPCKPFDSKRQGLNLGEGSGVIILESAEHAAKRNFKAELSLAAYGASADAYHITAPKPDGSGLRNAIETALRQVGISPAETAFVNAHGTGTESNDYSEALALAAVFGREVKFLSTKRFTGHTLGAAGALECIFSAQMLLRREIAPSAGFENKADNIEITPVTEITGIDLPYAVSTSLAFGGCNSAIVIKRNF